jgi:argininosuccinate lyase
MMATDLADYLVGKGIPFRETHVIAGQAVRAAMGQRLGLEQMPLEAYQVLSPAFEANVYQVFDPMESVKRRNAIGGTSPEAVKKQIAKITNH